ncbi:serine/threonine-protein phosphatase 2A regulatory subunit B'' subunit beta isoform X2 [Dendroctonus ponderosae]|uniref:serine/threonine-protein phosphatase 2A regulatory subunit B'' subunit beta isoform X2 n=1 Tax=Dendroctonus ponderosae TaxID=77166 RepID=UPI002035E182|nr:serine/threonine-protein phosphatase 2A regulatory subunit B'' subunit beta isoform X2 [Dendroctonus ponderosae]
MAATARRRPGGSGDSAEDDIAAIAKQISDTAEVIYQNWKSRNLAPADLITCHAAGDPAKLGSMLKPQPPAKPSMDLLAQAPSMDNNRLEKLVKNFVHEDKARLAAQAAASKTPKPMPSSIQYALRKFEKGSVVENGFSTNGPKKPGPVASSPAKKSPNFGQMTVEQTYSSPLNKPTIGQKPQISPKPAHLSDTIEMTLPPELSPGLQTWPLKNRVISTENVGKKSGSGPGLGANTPAHTNNSAPTNSHSPLSPHQFSPSLQTNSPALSPVQPAAGRLFNTLPLKSSKTTIDEVALEEKRLINALKNGDVVNEEPIITQIPSKHIIREPEKASEGTTKWGLRSTSKRPEQQVPHPELTSSQRLHLRQTAANPVRPFLTRGSVAERVLIFERCPSDLLLDKRVRAPVPQTSKPQPLPKQASLQHTTLQRHVRAHRNVNIPRFHYPAGKPVPPGQLEVIKSKVKAAFAAIGDRASREHFGAIIQECQLPLYWKTPLYLAACADKGACTFEQFMTFWQGMASSCHDAAARFVYILTRGRRQYLVPEDFIPMVQDVVETHPGLTFLKEATEFHSRYVHTVIARIYYCVNRSWSAKISIAELRRSNLLTIIQLLEEEEDINQITHYFSYEHFYVIYCKFWELDRDHDLFIDKQDLTRHNDHALSSRIIDRIFCGCVTRGNKRNQEEKMSYTDFVWFLLSEEDKLHPTAIEYWFRCMDLDGDGYLSMYELEYFYEEQMQRMDSIGIETLPFQDCLCQMLDLVKPKIPGKIALSDLKKCKMTSIFFDTFFNLEKYLDHEQRDPFASQRDHDLDGMEMSDWDRYAAEEYELLVAEEGGNDQNDSINGGATNETIEDLLKFYAAFTAQRTFLP